MRTRAGKGCARRTDPITTYRKQARKPTRKRWAFFFFVVRKQKNADKVGVFIHAQDAQLAASTVFFVARAPRFLRRAIASSVSSTNIAVTSFRSEGWKPIASTTEISWK